MTMSAVCRHPYDSVGHNCFRSKTTTKNGCSKSNQGHYGEIGSGFQICCIQRDRSRTMVQKPDVELVDPSGELRTISLDETLSTLHQEAITSREDVHKSASKAKEDSYPRKDSYVLLAQRKKCVSFILTNMGGYWVATAKKATIFYVCTRNATKVQPFACLTSSQRCMQNAQQS